MLFCCRQGEWTPDEEYKLVQGHMKVGSQWAALTSHLPSRSENDIKIHWNATMHSVWAAKLLERVPRGAFSSSYEQLPFVSLDLKMYGRIKREYIDMRLRAPRNGE
jgi:hypothetical protein